MDKVINPIDSNEIKMNGSILKFSHFKEIGQGGPMVAELFVNGKIMFQNYRFGLPILVDNGNIYAVARVFKRFDICKIQLNKRQIYFSGLNEDFIELLHLKDNCIYYKNGVVSFGKVRKIDIEQIHKGETLIKRLFHLFQSLKNLVSLLL